MTICRELDPMSKHRTQFVFKGKKGHIAKVNNVYPNQHIDIEIPHGSRDYVFVIDIVKFPFNFYIKLLMLGSKETDTTNNSDIYDTYKDF